MSIGGFNFNKILPKLAYSCLLHANSEDGTKKGIFSTFVFFFFFKIQMQIKLLKDFVELPCQVQIFTGAVAFIFTQMPLKML